MYIYFICYAMLYILYNNNNNNNNDNINSNIDY